jgi:hypothetical protein
MSHVDRRARTCPSCLIWEEHTSHISRCPEVRRVEAFLTKVDSLEIWLHNINTDPELHLCILEFLQDRGQRSMTEIVEDLHPCFQQFGVYQDITGWPRFLEGMVSKEIIHLQAIYVAVSGSQYSTQTLVTGLICKLLEITHGQ